MTSDILQVSVVAVEDIRRLPGTWEPAACRTLLGVLELDDAENTSDADALDMALMALQDLKPEQAMQVVLSNFSDGQFTRGQIQNLCEESKEESAWEEYAENDHQRSLFVCIDLLNMAFPHDYPEPEASEVKLSMRRPGLAQQQTRTPLDPATLLRVLGRCQDETNILNRFFPEQIAGAAFPEAAAVIWDLQVAAVNDDELTVVFCGSKYWFRGLDEDEELSCKIDWSRRGQARE